QWDLIVISKQLNWTIFQAHYAIAQLRAWRPMVIEIAIRIVAIELLLLETFRYWVALPVSLGVYFTPLSWIIFAPLGIVGLVYGVEPLWRMKALTALSLAVVSRIKNASAVHLTLFGLAIGIHVLQIAPFILFWAIVLEPVVNDEYGFLLLFCL